MISSDNIYENQSKNWGDFHPNCTGIRQSPINIQTNNSMPITKKITALNFYNKVIKVDIVDKSLKTTANFGNLILRENSTDLQYDALQFHIHIPSEHEINQNSYDLEMHFVFKINEKHQNVQNTLTVLGFFFQNMEDSDNQFLNDWIFNGKQTNYGIDVNFASLNSLLKQQFNYYYHYLGSLTTPSCDEIVNWFVFENPVNMSRKQKESLLPLFKPIRNNENHLGYGNNRKLQKLNNRVIYKGCLQIQMN